MSVWASNREYTNSMLATGLADLIQVISSVNELNGKPDTGFLEVAAFVNRLVNLGFTCADIGMAVKESKIETKKKVKTLELLPRIVHFIIQASKEYQKSDGSLVGKAIFIEEGVISPGADVIRTLNQKFVYDARFDQSPEQSQLRKKNAEKEDEFNWKFRDAEREHWQWSDKAAEDSSRLAQSSAYIRLITQIGTVRIVTRVSVLVYRRLAALFVDNPPARREVPANHRPAPNLNPVQAQIRREFSLLDLAEIPEPLQQDVVLRRYNCAINHQPARDPVADPTANNLVIYERATILEWIRRNGTSPMTRRPLRADQLRELPAVRAIIDHRLQAHERHLWEYVEQAPNLQPQLHAAPDPNLDANARRELPNYP